MFLAGSERRGFSYAMKPGFHCVRTHWIRGFIAFQLARYKVPKRFEFCELPKTSTGKIQKNVLRDRAHEL